MGCTVTTQVSLWQIRVDNFSVASIYKECRCQFQLDFLIRIRDAWLRPRIGQSYAWLKCIGTRTQRLSYKQEKDSKIMDKSGYCLYPVSITLGCCTFHIKKVLLHFQKAYVVWVLNFTQVSLWKAHSNRPWKWIPKTWWLVHSIKKFIFKYKFHYNSLQQLIFIELIFAK